MKEGRKEGTQEGKRKKRDGEKEGLISLNIICVTKEISEYTYIMYVS